MHASSNELSILIHLFICLSLAQYYIVLITVFLYNSLCLTEQVILPYSSSVVSQ